jgi:hypothetical protein
VLARAGYLHQSHLVRHVDLVSADRGAGTGIDADHRNGRPELHAPANAQPGTTIKINSQLKAANGVWTINKISYLLASEMPNGPWELSLLTSPAPV